MKIISKKHYGSTQIGDEINLDSLQSITMQDRDGMHWTFLEGDFKIEIEDKKASESGELNKFFGQEMDRLSIEFK